MPDFTLLPQPSNYFKSIPWTDPPSDPLPRAISDAGGQAAWDALTPDQQKTRLANYPPPRPSRVTTVQGRQHFAWTATLHTILKVYAQIPGDVAGAPDSSLGGRLFESWFAESPELPLQPSYPVGYTSRIFYTPHLPGHYVLVVRRDRGGGVVFHFDVVDPNAPAPP